MPRFLLLSLLAGYASPAAGGRPAVPLFFVANHGQAPPSVRYMAQGPELTAYFSRGEILFRLGRQSVRMQLEASGSNARLEGIRPLSGHVNFLVGQEENWQTGKAIYSAVAYRNVYPGIDMIYSGETRNLKSEFIVAPGADARRIRIRYSGAGKPHIDSTGALVFKLDGREFREDAPVIFQIKDNIRFAVNGRFDLSPEGSVGFVIDRYDAELPLIVDPVVYSTLLGGASSDSATAVATDASGAVYLTGFTASLDLPMINPAQSFAAGSNDVFVAKLNSSGNALVYCTYLGGRGDDRAYGIAVDAGGAAYITGFTTSTAFPTKSPLQNKLLGARNAFVAQLNPSGNMLVFSTFLGGSGSDTGNGIALDGGGNIYVTGATTSLNFPATGFQRSNRGGMDAFVAKLNPGGAVLGYSTLLGGTYDDSGAAIAVDGAGTAYVTGSTYSSDFPLANPQQGQLGGGQDIFITKLNSDGSGLVFSTFFGGSGGSAGMPETGQAIALDLQGNVHIAGATSSTNFPLLHAAQAGRRGSMDAVYVKVTSAGTLVNSTYLGGAGVETGNAIAVDSSGAVYVAGQTTSSDLPVASAVQSVNGGGYDGFLARFAPSGDIIPFLTYLGGSGSDTITALALDPAGNIYLAGWSLSTNFPVVAGYQSINAGSYGAFVTKLAAAQPPTADSVTPSAGSGASQTFQFQFSNSGGAAGLTSVSVLVHSSTSTSGACAVTYTLAGNSLALLTDAGTTPTATIAPGSGSQENSQCTLNGTGSSVSLSGEQLTLTVALSFKPAFAGSRNIYMQAANALVSTGWLLKGSWSISAGPPVPVSVSPSSGSGSAQTFTFTFSDPRGFNAISTLSVIIGNNLTGIGSCYLYFARAENAIYLANDAGTAWLTPVALGSSGIVQNSQCAVSAAGSSSSGSGEILTMNLSLTFQASYAGSKSVYMLVYDGENSGWHLKGSWTVTATGPPSVVSVTPSSGSGSSQSFTFVFASPRGYSTILTTSMIIGTSLAGSNSCYLYFARAQNAVYLANDAGTAWLAPAVPGTSGTVQNSQCSVNAASSSSSGAGNTLTLTLALSFQPVYQGSKNIYMQVSDEQNSGWSTKGSWTVPTPSVLTPISVTPNSGGGSSQAFSFLFYDPAGATSITTTSMIIGTSLAGSNSCYLYYARAANSIYLANDAGTAWLPGVVIGTAATLQNNQCSVNVSASTSSISGPSLTLELALTLKPAYAGSKTIYMQASNTSTNSGWYQRGAWLVQ